MQPVWLSGRQNGRIGHGLHHNEGSLPGRDGDTVRAFGVLIADAQRVARREGRIGQLVVGAAFADALGPALHGEDGKVEKFLFRVTAFLTGADEGDAAALVLEGDADAPLFAGMGLVGGAMFRDFAIVSTAFGADLREIKKVGWRGVASLFIGEFICLVAGIAVAYPLGYTSVVDMVTIGAGVATFVVGPVTGAALGASSEVIAISIAAGVVKSVLVMVVTPFVAKPLSINNPQSAMAFGGIMGTTSGTAAGIAAVNPKLVPYCAMTATFFTGLGCLLFPSVFYFATAMIF